MRFLAVGLLPYATVPCILYDVRQKRILLPTLTKKKKKFIIICKYVYMIKGTL